MHKIALGLVFLLVVSTTVLAQMDTTDSSDSSASSASPQVTPDDSGSTAPDVQPLPSPDLNKMTQIGNGSPSDLAAQKVEQQKALQKAGASSSPAQGMESDTEFQELVTSVVGSDLPFFGQDLFQQVPSTFAPLDRVQVTPDYIIEPDDELIIQAWGQIDVNYHVVVDRSGAIYIPKVGAVNVAGIRYGDLHDYLQSQIQRVFKNFQLTVSMGQLRSIQVYVVGRVKKPGSYTVSSLSSLLDALLASGGPAKNGSLRNIQLKRDGKVVTTFDVYDVIVNGDKTKDVTLMPGDVIYVPPAGPLVAVAGSVNTPAIFEIKEGSTLADVISYAGGLTTTADNQQAVVDRIENHQDRRTDEFPLDQAGLSRPVRDGDVIRVLHISPRFDNTVTLRGNVAVPGHYPWHQGMRVHDLIPTRQSLVTDEYWKKQNELALNREISGFLLPEPVQRTQKSIDQVQLKNDVKRISSEINWDYAVIERFDPHSLNSHLVPFELGKAIDGDESANAPLQPGDVITIFSQADIQVPLAQQSKFVHLEGEVKQAGVYEVQPGETLRHLVIRLGGVTPEAYLYGAEFTRESTRVAQQARLDEYVSTLDQSTVQPSTAAGQQALNPQMAAMAQAQAAANRAAVARIRKLKATGRIVLEIKPDADSVDALPNLTLEDGDRLLIPFRPATVNVIGSVYNSSAFIYKPGRTVADYLRQAGGPRRDADKGREFVVRADGSTVSKQQHHALVSRNFNTLRLMPGDTIVVPGKPPSAGFLRSLTDYTTLMGQFGLAAAGFSAILP